MHQQEEVVEHPLQMKLSLTEALKSSKGDGSPSDQGHDRDWNQAKTTSVAVAMEEEDEAEIKQIKTMDMGDQIQKVRGINIRFNVTLLKNMDIISLSIFIIKIIKLNK